MLVCVLPQLYLRHGALRLLVGVGCWRPFPALAAAAAVVVVFFLVVVVFVYHGVAAMMTMAK